MTIKNINNMQLWPEIKPFQKGFLKVSEIHKIHFALYGNPNGEPVFFLHGGPGCGCTDEDARWFDPARYFIITHDQRGSGLSIPRAEINNNTPKDLVNDIEKLRTYLKIDIPLLIFAGSWGTTLALLYAQAFPGNVEKMILRGAFTCSWDDQDYFYSEKGAARFSLKAWNIFINKLPNGRGRIQDRIHKLIEDSDIEGKKKWCRILAEYEYSFFNITTEEFEKNMQEFEMYFPEMRINIYYQANRFFLEDNQIINNSESIKNIPVTIIHGTNDVICPPALAVNLHKVLPKSTLTLVEAAGHLSSEPKIKQALLKELKEGKT